jgi:hypothetical protein
VSQARIGQWSRIALGPCLGGPLPFRDRIRPPAARRKPPEATRSQPPRRTPGNYHPARPAPQLQPTAKQKSGEAVNRPTCLTIPSNNPPQPHHRLQTSSNSHIAFFTHLRLVSFRPHLATYPRAATFFVCGSFTTRLPATARRPIQGARSQHVPRARPHNTLLNTSYHAPRPLPFRLISIIDTSIHHRDAIYI